MPGDRRCNLEELGQKLRQLEEPRAAAESALSEVLRGQRRIKELEAKKRALLEAYGNGILLRLDLFTPWMRRAIYEMLQLDVLISPNSMSVRSVVASSLTAPPANATSAVDGTTRPSRMLHF
jgi:hypothetical protein